MNIILQKYRNEAKIFLKEKLSKIISNISNEFIDNLFSNDANNKYVKIINSLTNNIRELIKNIILETINFFNDKFINDSFRKGKYHINVRNDPRSINIASIGQLDFNRTYFENVDGTGYFYFIDKLFDFDKYSKYDNITKANAIDLAMKTNQKLAGEILNDNTAVPIDDNYIIPRQTIHSWIKKWKIPTIKYSSIPLNGDTLYVMADEKWIHEQIKNINNNSIDFEKKKHNFIMSKCFVCFSGIKNIKKRRVLQDRFIFMTSTSSPWSEFMDTISQIYDFEKLDNIVFLSDGGKWLTSGAHDLKLFSNNHLMMCLCEFHAKQKIHRITANEELRKKLVSYLDNNEKKKFISSMIEIKKNAKDEKRLKKLEEYENYIVNNWKKIQNMYISKCKSSMESHISHYMASYFASRPKAYSTKNIQTLIKLQEAKANGIDIKKLYLKTYNNKNEKFEVTEKELNFSLFEKSCSSNIPVIEYGKNNSLFNTLINLLH